MKNKKKMQREMMKFDVKDGGMLWLWLAKIVLKGGDS